MTAIRFVLGDQLSHDLASLRDIDRAEDVVLMAEVMEEATYVRHHPQKIALVFSAMRHLAAELRAKGVRVDYITLDAPGNTGTFTGELNRAVARHGASRVVLTEPGEWRVLQMMKAWAALPDPACEIRPDDRFIAGHRKFARWAQGRRELRMEYFYREVRRGTGILMDGEVPCGGQWNFDRENRKPLPRALAMPERLRFMPDDITREVLDLVARTFPDHPGSLGGFSWPVTRHDARLALGHFIAHGLANFGDYQDAMAEEAEWLFHSLLSPALNIGLIDPREVCTAAEAAYRQGHAPINAVEGFIRQIAGWREYVHGLYWLKMPDYARSNALDADRPLPWFYWTGETAMNCLSKSIGATLRNAYAHHIQRLMVIGNFSLLAGLRPSEVEEWYLAVYADAFEWVELPNTHGMALFADGGIMASKPYAGSGAYINRMSDYCRSCGFDPKQRTGEKACPFNYLYWDFLMRNEKRLSGNPRLAMPYRTLSRLAPQEREAMASEARRFLQRLG